MWNLYVYNWIKGEKTLVAWATGLNRNAMKALYNIYWKEGYAMIEAKKV
jgi:hypothetical protein